MSQPLPSLVFVLTAYVLGSVPVAFLVGRLAGGLDIRRVGSGNPGALNVFRQVGGWAALVVLVADVGKGAGAVLFSEWLGASEMAVPIVALAVVAGHNWSVFLGLKGGKGAAAVLGISLAMLPSLALATLPFSLVALALTRNVVVSVGTGFVVLNVLTIATAQPATQVLLCLGLTVVVAGTHFYRARQSLVPAVKAGRWREVTRSE